MSVPLVVKGHALCRQSGARKLIEIILEQKLETIWPAWEFGWFWNWLEIKQ